MKNIKSHFLLDPEVTFLNHGSFGATSRPVFAVYQEWQRRLERQPVRFLGREIRDHLAYARHHLASYLHADEDDLAFVPNATFGLNLVARSLNLRPGDEVLTTNHEYGACLKTWQFLRRKHGFTLVEQPLPLPFAAAEDIVEQFWAGVTPRTRVIFLSHITSATAQHLPVETICARSRAAGILTIVDGAHAPGQIPLDLSTVGADYYTGNAHKWLCSPKGAAFLHARPEHQHRLEPLVVSWGWDADPAYSTGSYFRDILEWSGTNDYSAYLSIPAAINFQAEHNWPAVRQQCNQLLQNALAEIADLTGLPSLYPAGAAAYHQMAIARLPDHIDPLQLQTALYDQFRLEIPCYTWDDQHFIRLSVQGYNTRRDIDRLIQGLHRRLA